MTRLALFGLGVVVLASCDRIAPPTSPEASQAISFSAEQEREGGPFKEAAAAELVSCARNARGDVYCWGSNQYGSLGTGDYLDASTPRRVVTDVEFASITMSGSHVCGLTDRGDAYCWGQNASGELGAASTGVCPSFGRVLACSAQPLRVSGGIRFKTIDAGWRHNCGLTAEGEAYCWGWNQFGQLGAASTETCLSDGLNANPCSTTPVRVSGDLRFKSISAGFWQTCGLTNDEQTYCWGNNALGTFGSGSRTSSPNIPVPAATGVTLAQLSSGSGSACGITEDRVTMCWGGFNIVGELGDGTNLPHLVPQPIAGDFVSVRSVTAMNENNIFAHTCGIAADGQALCWGSNFKGELGVATTQTCRFSSLVLTCSNVAVAVAGDYRFRSVAVGYFHTCGVTTSGDVLCWGFNNRGQLGDGTTVDRQEPVPVATVTVACNCWSTKTSMPTARAGFGVAAIHGRLYAVGGDHGSGELATLEVYDPSTDTWTTRASMPTARDGLSVAAVDGILYAVGGSPTFTTLEAYDPSSNTWTSKAPLPTGRFLGGVAAVNGMLYAVGGTTSLSFTSGFVATVEAYDPMSDTWTTKASMPTARLGVAVVANKGLLYAVGGLGANTLATLEAYDPSTDTWTTKAAMPTARSGLGVAAIDGTLYAVGGLNQSGVLNTVEAYDPSTDTWTTKASMPTARLGPGVAAIHGQLYAAGGFRFGVNVTTGWLATLEAYQP